MGIDEVENYTPKQASEILKVNSDTLRRWNNHGKIQCTRLPGGHRRYSKVEIDRMLEKQKGFGFNLEDPLELRSLLQPIAKNILEQDTKDKVIETNTRATYAKLRTVRCIAYAVVLLLAFLAVFESVIEVLI